MNVAINDVDEAINKHTYEGMLWAEDRLSVAILGCEDYWPVAATAGPRPDAESLSGSS